MNKRSTAESDALALKVYSLVRSGMSVAKASKEVGANTSLYYLRKKSGFFSNRSGEAKSKAPPQAPPISIIPPLVIEILRDQRLSDARKVTMLSAYVGLGHD